MTEATPETPPTRATQSLVLQMALINLLWAGSSVAAKAALESFGPLTLALFRFLPAGIAMMILTRIKGPIPKIERRDYPRFALLGLLGITFTYSLYYNGLMSATASDASLLNACEPLLISLFAAIFLKERQSRIQWLGMSIGLVGVWLIAGQGAGTLLALFGLMVESSASVVSKPLVNRYPWRLTLGLELLFGSLFLAPFSLYEMTHSRMHPTFASVSGVVYLSAICTVLCFGLWYRNLSRFPVSLLSVFILLQPLFGPFVGMAFNGDRLSPLTLFGGALIAAGIGLSLISPAREQ